MKLERSVCLEEFQIDGLAHDQIAKGVGMDVVPPVVDWVDQVRIVRLPDDLVEVDDGVEGRLVPTKVTPTNRSFSRLSHSI